MNELIREIEDDIRRERFDKLWKSFGKVMIGISVAIILGTIVVVVMQDHKQSQAMERTAAFIKGIDRLNIEDYKGAIQVFSDLASQNSSSYYGLSMLRKAQAEMALSEQDEAMKTYGELAQHDPLFGELATLLMIPGESKQAEPVKSATTGSPFYYTHNEWRAWQLLQQDKKDEAVSQFLTLYNDPTAPSSMHGRLSEVLHHLAPEKLAANMETGETQHE